MFQPCEKEEKNLINYFIFSFMIRFEEIFNEFFRNKYHIMNYFLKKNENIKTKLISKLLQISYFC